MAELLRAENVEVDELTKSTDIVDVWLDSGLAWHLLDGQKADLVLEGRDQFRGWFSSLCLTSMIAQVSGLSASTLPRTSCPSSGRWCTGSRWTRAARRCPSRWATWWTRTW